MKARIHVPRGVRQASSSQEETGTTVLLQVKPNLGEVDAIIAESENHADYAANMQQAAFEIYRDITMDVDGKTYECLGSLLEYDVGIRATKNFLLTFAADERTMNAAQHVVIHWNDRLFRTGISAFVLK